MIRVTMLTGPYAGRTEVVPAEVTPHELLGEFLVKGWAWSIDYAEATEEEAFEWWRQDLSARVVRAIRRGLPVTFLGAVYHVEDMADTTALTRVIGEIEDAIVASGRVVTLGRDDETGVVVLAAGFSH